MEEVKKKKGRPKKIKEEIKEEQIILSEPKQDLPFPLNFVKNVFDLFLGKSNK